MRIPTQDEADMFALDEWVRESYIQRDWEKSPLGMAFKSPDDFIKERNKHIINAFR